MLNIEERTPVADAADPEIQVERIGPNAGQGPWRISQNLTDRWGEINDHDAENKPLAALLAEGGALLDRLRAQMWDGVTFVVRKDGRYGILFEVEYISRESDGSGRWPIDAEDEVEALLPQADVVAALKQALLPLAAQYAGVEFCIPDKSLMFLDRPGVWAFVPDGLLDGEARERLGLALLAL